MIQEAGNELRVVSLMLYRFNLHVLDRKPECLALRLMPLEVMSDKLARSIFFQVETRPGGKVW